MKKEVLLFRQKIEKRQKSGKTKRRAKKKKTQ